MLWVLLGHVRELAGQRHGLERDEYAEQQHEEDSKKGHRSMLFDHASTIGQNISNINRYQRLRGDLPWSATLASCLVTRWRWEFRSGGRRWGTGSCSTCADAAPPKGRSS